MDAYIGEIRLMPYNFAPKDWLQCLGQLLAIRSNTALFSLLGTNYGGDGQTTFGLPNLAGRAAIGVGNGAGLSPYVPGEATGSTSVALTANELPAHVHAVSGSVRAVAAGGATSDPALGYPAQAAAEQYGDATGAVGMAANSVTGGPTSVAGGGAPHDNMMPYLTLNFCICTNGIFPQRP